MPDRALLYSEQIQPQFSHSPNIKTFPECAGTTEKFAVNWKQVEFTGDWEENRLQLPKLIPSIIPLKSDFNRHLKERAPSLPFACREEKEKGINNSCQIVAWVIRHVGSKVPCALMSWLVTNLLLSQLVLG